MQLGKCHHETTNLRAPMPRPERRRLLATWVPMMMDVVVQLVSWLVFRAPTLMPKLDTLNPFQRTKGSWIMIQKLLRVIFLFAIYPWFVRCNSNNEEVDHISQISNYIITVRGRSNPSKVLKCSENVTLNIDQGSRMACHDAMHMSETQLESDSQPGSASNKNHH